MNFIKKHWPSVLHILALLVIFLDPSVEKYLHGNAQYGAAALVVWSEIMHWLQSPNQGAAQ